MTTIEPVIGLEVHVQLDTATKLFCADPAGFGADPNSHVCAVCLGLPGALPVTNGRAVELAVRAALGLHCTVSQVSRFARKHYFYPDLPKGYQITQHDEPLATAGWLYAPDGGNHASRVRIRRVHLEEDAGRSLHDRLHDRTAIDFNRAGIPLIEIVTEPELTSPSHARAFLARLKQLLEYLDVSDCEMEKGSLRVDANVSVRAAGVAELGVRTEVKNMNSFSAVERALQFEVDRQAAILRAGGVVVHETLQWDADRAEARRMRTKERAADYRYLLEPDLPALVLGAPWVEATRAGLPEAPDARARRFEATYGLEPRAAAVLTATRPLAEYFEALAGVVADPEAASNWVRTEVLGWLNREGVGIDAFPVPPARLAGLLDLVQDGTLPRGLARRVLQRMAATGRTAAAILEAEGLTHVRDPDTLAAWVDEAIDAHQDEVRRYRAGEVNVLNFLIGRIMDRSGGRADPRRLGELLRTRLGEWS